MMKSTPRAKKNECSPEAVLLAAAEAQKVLQKNQLTFDEYLDREITDELLRRRLSNLLFTLFRNKRAIDKAIKSNCTKAPDKEVYFLLSAASAMAAYQDSLPPESVVNIAVDTAKKNHNIYVGKFVNALLRKVLRALKEPFSSSLPPQLERRWQKEFGSEQTALLDKLFTQQPPSTVRLRSSFAEPGETLELDELPLALPWKFFQSKLLAQVLASESFRQGAFYIQDPAPAKVCQLLQKYHDQLPEKVKFIDLCAAPGGKLIMNMELLQQLGHQTEAVALDRSAKRLELVRKNLKRCALTAQLIADDATKTPQLAGKNFELVTCDVPCSNSGVFRRRPDALWRWNRQVLPEITALQKSILANAGKLTAPGGLLLYSTCSLEKEENQMQIEAFLAENHDFKLLEMTLFMPDEYCDGTFAALLKKSEDQA